MWTISVQLCSRKKHLFVYLHQDTERFVDTPGLFQSFNAWMQGFATFRPRTSTICICSVFPALAGYMALGLQSKLMQVNQPFVTQSVAQGCFRPWSWCWWVLSDSSRHNEMIMKPLFCFPSLWMIRFVDGDVSKNQNKPCCIKVVKTFAPIQPHKR